jgi:NADH:ubiquinone oxidoreductase subunit C
VIGEKIQASFGDAVLSTRSECGMEVVEVTRAAIPKVLAFLDSDPDLAFTMLLDVTAVDGLRLGWRDRFRVVYHLYSLARNERVRVVASVPESADWLERETWDQYGIVFEGHPNLVRLLNHKEFVGHPLRKDYDIKKGQWLSEPDDLLDQLEKARQGILSEY